MTPAPLTPEERFASQLRIGRRVLVMAVDDDGVADLHACTYAFVCGMTADEVGRELASFELRPLRHDEAV